VLEVTCFLLDKVSVLVYARTSLRREQKTLTSATSFRVDRIKYVAMHIAKMHEIHIAVMQVAVHVAKAAEQRWAKVRSTLPANAPGS